MILEYNDKIPHDYKRSKVSICLFVYRFTVYSIKIGQTLDSKSKSGNANDGMVNSVIEEAT